MSGVTGSPLARLVLFMVCLAVAGALVSGLHYIAVDVPAQKAASAPDNWGSSCMQECKKATENCIAENCPGEISSFKCIHCNVMCGAMCGDQYY